MAFDGATVRALSRELSDRLTDRKISKIAQPEKDELIFTIKGGGETVLLFASGSATLPLLYITEERKKSPDTAPAFCMVLRKHLQGGRITAIEQMGAERVIRMSVEHLDEMGDLSVKYLYFEIMGRHSNIIFTDSNDNIIDAIKRINSFVSSVREVLPGKKYFIPAQEGKCDPDACSEDFFMNNIMQKGTSVAKALQGTLTGFGTTLSEEVSYRAGVDSSASTAALSPDEKRNLYLALTSYIKEIDSGDYSPVIYRNPDTGEAKEFSPLSLDHLSDMQEERVKSVSEMLFLYYSSKNKTENIKQKSEDIRKLLHTLISRNKKTYAIQEKQLADTEKMDTYRVYGELLHTYGHTAPEKAKEITVDNYYTGEKLTIPLDPRYSAMENAARYFARYDKLKRTKENVTERIENTRAELDHLSSIEASLSFVETAADLSEIRREMHDAGFTKKSESRGKKKTSEKAAPLHFVTKDGFHVYVGKNNFQNEEVTFKLGSAKDMWFHVKTLHGSHVIIKTEGKELPDEDYIIGAQVAAYFSEGRDSDKVEVDYVQRKEVKKTPGTAPGYVIYYTNYSMLVHPSLEGVTKATGS
ncbi:MAG: NFACT RNA binding domain-containing protein [Lachnospiraceae bacterium]|nr:NFACT RNA binding domain-containing protein [Lachnospiraceae bacterium]